MGQRVWSIISFVVSFLLFRLRPGRTRRSSAAVQCDGCNCMFLQEEIGVWVAPYFFLKGSTHYVRSISKTLLLCGECWEQISLFVEKRGGQISHLTKSAPETPEQKEARQKRARQKKLKIVAEASETIESEKK